MPLDLSQNKIIRFLIVAAVLYLIWLIIYHLGISQHTNWDFHLNDNIAFLAQIGFDWMGKSAEIVYETDHVVLYLNEGSFRGIWIGDACNGFKLFSIFTIFIIAYPGPWKTKLWYIPIGMLSIHLANVIRVIALLLINNYYPQYLDFNHLYTFTIFVYSIIFLFWYIWAKRIAHVKTN
jgi:exosortase/archaeosortase family protein